MSSSQKYVFSAIAHSDVYTVSPYLQQTFSQISFTPDTVVAQHITSPYVAYLAILHYGHNSANLVTVQNHSNAKTSTACCTDIFVCSSSSPTDSAKISHSFLGKIWLYSIKNFPTILHSDPTFSNMKSYY